ncbi:AMP-binding protein [Nocardioides pocheonensis]|uniref:4-coumarate--CoA ligase family protein n=1 Tax=Nocardioides pocheonensis TaxID=661485 RepID=A0A3N0GJJ0_9ACTN|nr:AMP-binding protein [Nocardioides pocheonensis]RNM12637.1 4-coumarate--CoA ligase family protein [Nocardioides pocheonensis]
MPIASPFPDVEIPECTVFDFLFGAITPAESSAPAITDGSTGLTTSYGDLVAQIEAVAGAFAARGLRIGDVVALHSPNSPMFAAVFHGVLRAGGTVTTVNALYTAQDLLKQLQDSGATFLVTVSPLFDAASRAAAEAGIPTHRLIVLDAMPGHDDFAALLAQGAPAPRVDISPDQVAVLPYSSGTTGVPKGVMLTHRNLVANVAQSDEVIGIRRDDAVLAVLPFFHVYGLTVLLNLALRARAHLVTMPRFDLEACLRLIQDQRLTYLFIAPPVAVALAKNPLVEDFDLTSVHSIFSGAAPLDGETAAAVERRLGTRVRQGYGMSELSPVSHVVPIGRDDLARSSVGFPVPNTTNKLVDPSSGQEVTPPDAGTSEPGELWVKGPNVMAGYLSNPEATLEMIDKDGYLHTGDLAVIDADGAIHVVDRLKELIKYKGYQVPPAELEALLLTHPGVQDAAVVGAQDDNGEEVPKAFVVVREGAHLTDSDVIDYVAQRVAPHKKVRQVEFLDAIPKSATGKILRKDLRQRPSVGGRA